MKKNKFLLFTSIFSVSLLTIPTLTSCAQNLNFQKGDVFDSTDTGSSGNNISLTQGIIADEIKNSINPTGSSVHLMTANKTIDYYDYINASVDSNGQYIYIHDRGEIIKKELNANPTQNKNNFIKTFNFYEYQKEWNKNIDDTNSGYSKIVNPSSELFLKDIYSWLLQIWNVNDKFFNIDIASKDITFSKNANTNELGNLSFDLKFNLTNVNDKTLPLKIYNKEIKLSPKQTYSLRLKAESQKIINVINDSNNRFFLSWKIQQASLQITNLLNLNITDFQPITKTNSNAYEIEFLNLTSDKQYSGNETTSKEFMNSLTSDKLKELIQPEFTKELNSTLDFLPYVSKVFNSLNSNPTLGKFLYDIAPFAEYLVDQLNIAPTGFGSIVGELLKSVHTGKGVIDIINDNKEELANSLKVILAPVLGPMTELVYTILTPIKPDMTKDDVEGFKKLIDMFTMSEDTKKMILKIIDVLMGSYDAQGNKVDQGNPYILDLLDFLVVDMKETFIKLLNIDPDLFNMISTLYQMLTARDKNGNITDISKGYVNFHDKIIDKLFDIKYDNNDYTKTTWWVIDTLKSVLKIMSVDFGTQSQLIEGIIQQAFALDVNKIRLNKQNFIILINEFDKLIAHLSSPNSYKVEGSWLKINNNLTNNDFEYNKETHQTKFKYHQKIIFNSEYTFNVASIINFLPSDIYLDLSAVLGENLSILNQNINVKGQYLRINLDYLLFGFLPKKITVNKNDSYNQIFTLKDEQLYYSQKVVDNINYNGINGLFDIESYFIQSVNNKGIISSWLNSTLKASDYDDTNVIDDLKMNQNLQKANVVAKLFYESKTNKQTKQNLDISKQLVKNLVLDTKHTSKQLYVYDKDSVIDNSLGYNHNIYTDGYTFRWMDNDLSNEFLLIGEKVEFKSKKYNEYKSLIKNSNTNARTYNYQYVSSKNNSVANDTISSSDIYFDQNDQNKIKNEFFTLGDSFNENDYSYSISPLFNLDIQKIVDLEAGLITKSDDGTLNTPLFLLKNKNIKLNIELYAYQVGVALKTNALDLTNLNVLNNTTKLSSYSYNNYYSKTIIAPRISLITPSFSI